MKNIMLALLAASVTAIAGTYNNPIITADFSDPDMVRVGDDYYMTASSFNIVPGLPILHSKDLINWERIGYALQNQPKALFPYRNRKAADLDYDRPRHGKGVFAPCIRHHDGFFWIFWCDPDAGLYMTKSKKAEGPWSKPHLVAEASGWIDSTPLWDDDGKAYLAHAYAHSRSGINNRIVVLEMSPDGTKILSDEVVVHDANNPKEFPTDRKHSTIEGAKFMKRNGWYYILCPAGGVPTGWQAVLRSKKPMGPYEVKTVCEKGPTKVNGPHQGGLVDTPDGKNWWFAHFQSTDTLGRIVWLQPAKWVDGWPIIGVDLDDNGIGNPVMEHAYPLPSVPAELTYSDDFSSDTLGLQWQWRANPQTSYYQLKDGQLILPAIYEKDGNLQNAPSPITQMYPAFHFTTTAKVTLDSKNAAVEGGLASVGRKCFSIGLHPTTEGYALRVRHGNDKKASQAIDTNTVWLRYEAKGQLPLPLRYRSKDPGENGKMEGQCSYSLDGKTFTELGAPFTPRTGTWIGARTALYCLSSAEDPAGTLTVDDFEVEILNRLGQQSISRSGVLKIRPTPSEAPRQQVPGENALDMTTYLAVIPHCGRLEFRGLRYK